MFAKSHSSEVADAAFLARTQANYQRLEGTKREVKGLRLQLSWFYHDGTVERQCNDIELS